MDGHLRWKTFKVGYCEIVLLNDQYFSVGSTNYLGAINVCDDSPDFEEDYYSIQEYVAGGRVLKFNEF